VLIGDRVISAQGNDAPGRAVGRWQISRGEKHDLHARSAQPGPHRLLGQKSGGKGAEGSAIEQPIHRSVHPFKTPGQKQPGTEAFVPKSISLDEPGAPPGDAKAFPLSCSPAASLQLCLVLPAAPHALDALRRNPAPGTIFPCKLAALFLAALHRDVSCLLLQRCRAMPIMGALIAAYTLTSLFSDSIDPASRFWCRSNRVAPLEVSIQRSPVHRTFSCLQLPLAFSSPLCKCTGTLLGNSCTALPPMESLKSLGRHSREACCALLNGGFICGLLDPPPLPRPPLHSKGAVPQSLVP